MSSQKRGTHKVVEKKMYGDIIVHSYGSEKKCEKYALYLSKKYPSSKLFIVERGTKIE